MVSMIHNELPTATISLNTMGAVTRIASEMSAENTDISSDAAAVDAGVTATGGYPLGFLMKLESAIESMQQSDGTGALLLLSIDNLAMIVSGYGFATSEKIMDEVEQRIAHILKGERHDVLRVQRDQFGIILRDCDATKAESLAASLIDIVQGELFDANDYGALHIMSMISTIALPERAATAEEALDLAYVSLHDNSGQIMRTPDYAESLSANARQQMGLANYLSQAIREDRLGMAYQPIINSKTGEIGHYEALLRLHGKDGRISSAGALVPIAEKMGMIDVIDQKVLHMVVNELRSSPNVHLALNVSNLTTRNDVWLEEFRALLAETPEIAERMIVEITETAVQRDMRRTGYFVGSVQALGAKVALDDFGSGYTSFRQLKQLSVDMVKIDGAFIKDLVDNADNRFFVKTLLDFTNGFGLTSVAEFVENGEIAKMLMELGVQYLQGYYFGRPENHRSWLNDGEYSA